MRIAEDQPQVARAQPLAQHFSSQTRRWCMALGMALFVQLSIAISVKLATGDADDLWWLSYVTLALAAVAMLLRSISLTATLVTCLSIPHFMWLFDAAVGLATGRFPLRLTGYLPEADFWVLLATSHHFYLWPMLCVTLWRMARDVPHSQLPQASHIALAGMAIVLALTIGSRLALPAEKNINFAYAVFPGVDEPLGHAINALSPPAYLLVLNLFAMSVVIVPGRSVAMTLLRSNRGKTGLGEQSTLARTFA